MLFDFHVAATYAYLALFLITNDDIPRASFFVQNVQKYIAGVAAKYIQDASQMLNCQVIRSKFLLHIVRLCDLLSAMDWDMEMVSSRFSNYIF